MACLVLFVPFAQVDYATLASGPPSLAVSQVLATRCDSIWHGTDKEHAL